MIRPCRARALDRPLWQGVAAVVLLGLQLQVPASAQDAGSASGGTIPLGSQADGARIGGVDVELLGGGANPTRDAQLLEVARSATAWLEGQPFSAPKVERSLAPLKRSMGRGSVNYRVLDDAQPGDIRLLIEIDPEPADGTSAETKLPTLHEDDHSKYVLMLSGGLGIYHDANPWFGNAPLFLRGNPVAGNLPGSQTTWTEGHVEYGVGGITQLGQSEFYLYGVLTGLTSWTLGQDIYRDGARSVTGIEKAYAGVIFASSDRPLKANLSLGRQNVTLNDGYLIHFVRGSGNAGPRGGTYLGPRNANDFSVVLDVDSGPWSLKAMYIDPNELGSIESNSKFAALNLGYSFRPGLSIDASYIEVVESDSSLVLPGPLRQPREGLRTFSAHARWMNALGYDGLWLQSEVAHQTHPNFDMSAWAGYGLIGYRASDLPWKPSLSYRYSYASGDDPSSATYERFDSLLISGLGNWLQGVSLGKFTTNSNLSVHRLQFNVSPEPTLNLTLDWHLLRAQETNNLGASPALASLSSRDLGQEVGLTARWSINPNLYLQTFATIAFPGDALKSIGASENWITTQASLYWTF